ncbi:hypothetical protein J6590_076581 [Homalodisca vitripennis]|nr:hypothetical protein J6590_076581 [Homalodisca vitripennis]
MGKREEQRTARNTVSFCRTCLRTVAGAGEQLILEVIRVGVDKGPDAGYEAESKGFAELAMTPQSKGLMGLFRGQTECKKNRFGTPKQEIK